MSPKLPVLRSRDIIRALKRTGYEEWRQRGSHLSLYRKTDNRSVTIPVHFGSTVPRGTLKAIIEQAGLSTEEFVELLDQ